MPGFLQEVFPLLFFVIRTLINGTVAYVNTEGIQPQNGKGAALWDRVLRYQLYQYPCYIAEFCQVLDHNSWDLLLPRKKFTLCQVQADLTNWRLQRLFSPHLFISFLLQLDAERAPSCPHWHEQTILSRGHAISCCGLC